MIFGAGFVSATAIIGLAFGLILFSVPTLHSYLMLAVCAFAIIFGLHLLGLLKLPSLIQTKPLIRKIARKYVSVYYWNFPSRVHLLFSRSMYRANLCIYGIHLLFWSFSAGYADFLYRRNDPLYWNWIIYKLNFQNNSKSL